MKKNIFRVLLAVGAIATVFAGCRKSELQQAQEPIKVTLRADRPGVQDETKTQLNGTAVLWSVDDQIGVTDNAETNPKNYYFTNDAQEPTNSTTFTGVNVSGNLFAYYPYSSEKITSNCARPTIKTVQTPGSNASFDGSCDILVSKPFTVSTEGKQLSDLVFRRLTAVLKISIKDGGIPSGEEISSITVESSETNLTGKVNVSFDKFDLDGFTSSGVKSVTVNAKNPFVADGTGTIGLFACVYPGEFAAGTKLTISGTMSNYTFKKEITLTDKITFERGKITTLKVEIGDGHLTPLANYSGTYMITNVTTDDATKYAMKCYESGNNIKGLEYTINTQGKAVAEDIEDCKYVIEKVTDGEYKGMYTIKDVKNKYLYAAGSNENTHLKSSSIPEDGNKKLYYWDINTSDDGATYNIVASKSGISKNVIRYNNLFSCYATGAQKAVTLFPWSNVSIDTTPKIKVSATELDVDADGNPKGDAITVSGNRYTGDISASVTEGNTWLTGVSITDNKIEITATKNETAVTRNATIKLTATGAEPVEIAVTQDAAGTELPKQVTISYSDIPDGFTATTGTSGTFTKTVISADDLTIAYAGINTKSKIEAVDHAYKYAMFLQNKGFIYSNNALDGYYVSKVTVTFSSSTGETGKAGIIFGSTAASVSSRDSSVTGSVSKSGTCVASNTSSTNTFWNFSTTSANVQVDKIEVEYTKK